MRVIGVLDLRRGQAVHARGGARDRYAPVAAVAGAAIAPGDAVALARRYLDALAVRELYVADLDAIVDGAPQPALVAALTSLGAPVWLDAAVADAGAARRAVGLGAAHVVVGLETLGALDALAAIGDAVAGRGLALSIDLRAGALLARAGAVPPGADAAWVAERAAEHGVGALIVLDLARVGAAAGPDLALVQRVRAAAPRATLLAGGGVRDLADLRRLAGAGCDGALVATALLGGGLGADEVRAAAGGWLGGGHGGEAV